MFKILANNTVIGVIDTPVYVRYQTRNNKTMACDELLAQGVVSGNGKEIYHLSGHPAFPEEGYTSVVLVEIDAEEYEILKATFDKNENIVIEEPVDEIQQNTLEYVINSKILQMNKKCNETIVEGFDVELSDGNTYHFDLTLEDQINMIALKDLLNSGEEQIAYHCAGGVCKFFSSDDIRLILEKADNFKNYNLVYYNSLKNYIKTLKDIKTVNAIDYGCKIPKKYQSEVLKSLLA